MDDSGNVEEFGELIIISKEMDQEPEQCWRCLPQSLSIYNISHILINYITIIVFINPYYKDYSHYLHQD